MRWSIRNQLLVPLSVLIVGTFGVSAWSAYSAADRARRAVQSRVAGVAQTLSAPHFPLTQSVLERIKSLSGAELLLVHGSSQATATFDLPAEELSSIESHLGADRWLGQRAQLGGREFLFESIQLPARHPNAGGTLYVLYPRDRFDAEVMEAIRPPLILGFAGGIVAVGLTIGVGRRLIRRLRELDRQTRRIADGDFRSMPLGQRNDELRDLSQSVNEMAERLQLAQDRMRHVERLRLLGQLSGGLAHQLRNGVAGAKLAVQLHAQDCAGGDAEALQVAHRQLARIEADVARFLDLGRRDELDRRPLPMMELVQKTADLLRHQCRHADVEFGIRPSDSRPIVMGDAVQMEHLLLNLFTNAIEAAGPGGRVEIALRQPQPEVCLVEVSDSGPGPPAEISDRLFEPFVTGKTDGIGLGLFIAQQNAEAHGGRLDWRRERNMTVLRCEFPAHFSAALAQPASVDHLATATNDEGPMTNDHGPQIGSDR